MALVVIEVRFKASNGVVFSELHDGHIHAGYPAIYASEGGTCFLKFICVESGESRLGYIINYKIRPFSHSLSSILS